MCGVEWLGGDSVDKTLITEQLSFSSIPFSPCKRAIYSPLILTFFPLFLLWGHYGEKKRKRPENNRLNMARQFGCWGTGLARAGGKVPALIRTASVWMHATPSGGGSPRPSHPASETAKCQLGFKISKIDLGCCSPGATRAVCLGGSTSIILKFDFQFDAEEKYSLSPKAN